MRDWHARASALLLALAAGCGQAADQSVNDSGAPPGDAASAATADQSARPSDQSVHAPDLAGCAADGDCRTMDARRCDLASGRCVPCLPASDNCPAGQYCAKINNDYSCQSGCRADGDCGGNTPHCNVSLHQCAACVSDDHCGAGTVCAAGSCVPGCTAQHACDNGLVCCAMRCTDGNSDAANCGACGVRCGGGTACCGGACSDTAIDARNCGGCGMGCMVPNAMPGCAMGRCTLGKCNQGFGDCNGNVADGCESAFAADASNCGSCGHTCVAPNAMSACVGGNCTIAACDPRFRDCNNDPADGCEVNVSNDVKNCGACRSNCQALPHATAGCSGGACVVLMCSPGFGNCDKVDANGCESDLGSDAANCAACGKPCPAPPNVMVSCANSMCAKGGCVAGYSDCNNNMADGCEAKLAADPKNCAKCGVVCPGLAHASAGCSAGVCGLGACDQGFGNCDNNAQNGCETDLTGDANNCGACGTVCQQGQKCSNGSCQVSSVCATADEGATATLTCPQGMKVASIDFASYGTPTGTCGNFAYADCDAVNSLMIVQGLCLGMNTCSVDANNNVFGDPCFGIVKHLYIQATCQ